MNPQLYLSFSGTHKELVDEADEVTEMKSLSSPPSLDGELHIVIIGRASMNGRDTESHKSSRCVCAVGPSSSDG